MGDKLLYMKGAGKIRQLLKDEEIPVPRFFLDNLLQLLSTICTYEEEERKIKPTIILSENIDDALKEIPTSYKLETFVDKRSGKNINKALKSLMPFCCNGWIVYINISLNSLEYGLLRAFTGPQGLSLTDILFEDFDSSSLINYRLVEIRALTKYEMKFVGLKGADLTIDYRFSHNTEELNSFSNMVEDITSGIPSVDNQNLLKKVFNKMLIIASERVHGTICVVVKSNYQNLKKHMPDGTWLSTPIDISAEALNAIQIKDINSSEKFYGLSGLLLEMMNIDGITVIDDLGRIVAFNVFLGDSNSGRNTDESGGARKRAANAVLGADNSTILGVYFQSQDGSSFYKRI